MIDFRIDKQFNKLVMDFKKLKLSDKKRITIEELTKIILVIDKALKNNNHNNKVLFNNEIYDLDNGLEKEEDYVEALYVYINSIQELIGEYIELSESRKNNE